jgi:serine/threonine protein phosphatase PrpC/CRP-like cAMP-binding protein
MTFDGHGASDKGQKRENNEDRFFVDNERGIYIVCDGMGGHEAGEVASSYVTNHLAKTFQEHAEWSTWLKEEREPAQLLKFVKEQVEQVCAEVYEQSEREPAKRGMGTTLTMLLKSEKRALLAHVGDSRMYMYRAGEAHQLTADHTMVQEFINRGIISAEEAKTHPYRNVLMRNIGTHSSVEVDLLAFDVFPDDLFVLCSDGLSNYIENDAALTALIEKSPAETLAQSLVDFANEAGGSDNITVVTVRNQISIDPTADVTLRDNQFPTWDRASRMCFHQLRMSFLCEGFQMRHVMRMFNQITTRKIEKGTVITQQGDVSPGLYIVLEGSCDISQSGLFTRLANEGQYFGLDALTVEEPSLETITAIEPTLLMVIERDMFLRFTRKRPRMGTRLLHNVAQEQSRRWRMFKTLAADTLQQILQNETVD